MIGRPAPMFGSLETHIRSLTEEDRMKLHRLLNSWRFFLTRKELQKSILEMLETRQDLEIKVQKLMDYKRIVDA